MGLSLADGIALLTTLFPPNLGCLCRGGIGNPKVGICPDVARRRLVSAARPRSGKSCRLWRTAGEPGWDRTNDLLIKSLSRAIPQAFVIAALPPEPREKCPSYRA